MNDADLFERYFRETLTVGELEELKRRLRQSAQTRRAFALYTQERSILVRLTGRLAGMESRDLPDLPAAPRRALPAPRPRRPLNPYLVVAGVAAAAVILLSILLTLPTPPATSPTQETTRKAAPKPPPEPLPQPEPELPKPPPEPPPPVTPKPEIPNKPEEPKKPEEPTPKPIVPAPKPEEPKKPEPPPPVRETVAEKAIASLEKADGTVRHAGLKAPLKAGDPLLPGAGVETVGPRSAAVIAYPDGTRLRLEGETAVRDLRADEAGKRLTLDQGTLTADVAKQADGRPMSLSTPHGQATVLGTTFKLTVLPATSTRLEVRQGRVQFTRKSDEKSVIVQADQYTETADAPNGNGDAWTRYSRKVDTGTFAHITLGYKIGTRSTAGPTVGFDLLRIAPGGAGDDFEAMPRWDSAFDAPWGAAAAWTVEPGGQAGRFLQAARPGMGSSVKAKVYPVPSRTTIDLSAFLKCPSGSTADYWIEFGCRLGSHTAQDFDVNAGAWTILKKFDSSPDPDPEVRPLPPKK